MSTTYSTVSSRLNGTTGTGLDQLVDAVYADNSLAGNNSAAEITGGASSADQLNRIIVEAALATGAAADHMFTAAEVVAMNAWIRANRLVQWTALHGDDETGEETGYHLVQNDGANTNYFGKNLVNTVADGIYHFGFQIQGNNFLNEDGNANAALSDVGNWLNYFYKGSTWVNGDDTDATAGNTDTLTFTGGVTVDQLWFRHVGNDLEVRIVGTYEVTTIANWYSGSAQHIEQIKTSDGKTLRDTQVDSLVSAMASFAVPTAGQSTLSPAYQAALLPVISSSWA